MAEASIQAYTFVLVVGFAFGLLLYFLRSNRTVPLVKIKTNNRALIGFWCIVIGSFMIVASVFALSLIQINEQYYVLESYEFTPSADIDWIDYEPKRSWLKSAEISSTDHNPLKPNVEKRLRIDVFSDVTPEELVVHIFHEDYLDSFENSDDPANFRPSVLELDRIPDIEYDGLFSIRFNMTEYDQLKKEKPEQTLLFEIFETHMFEYSGKYFVQFSSKLKSGEIDHRRSPLALVEIPTEREIWDTEQIAKINYAHAQQMIENKKNNNFTYIGIGVAILLAGLTLMTPNVSITRNNVGILE